MYNHRGFFISNFVVCSINVYIRFSTLDLLLQHQLKAAEHWYYYQINEQAYWCDSMATSPWWRSSEKKWYLLLGERFNVRTVVTLTITKYVITIQEEVLIKLWKHAQTLKRSTENNKQPTTWFVKNNKQFNIITTSNKSYVTVCIYPHIITFTYTNKHVRTTRVYLALPELGSTH